jgi:hypothetical protein
MPHREAVDLLATAPVSASARVLEVFLTRDKGRDRGRAISLLADIDQDIAEELIAAVPAAESWLKDLPKAVGAIADREDDPDVELGREIVGLTLAAPSKRGTQGYYKALGYSVKRTRPGQGPTVDGPDLGNLAHDLLGWHPSPKSLRSRE